MCNVSKTSSIEETCSNVKRLKYDHPNPEANELIDELESLIVCEKQEKLYCGRHALRAISQRLDLFDDEYLENIGQNLAALEQINRNGELVQTTEYYNEESGEYDIQILKAALINIFDIELIQLNTVEPISGSFQHSIISNMENVQALLVQQDYHYYCLRRFRSTTNYFFQIDSKSPVHHERIDCVGLLNHIDFLLKNRSNVYVAIKRIIDTAEGQSFRNDIKRRLWCFADAPADSVFLLSTSTHK